MQPTVVQCFLLRVPGEFKGDLLEEEKPAKKSSLPFSKSIKSKSEHCELPVSHQGYIPSAIPQTTKHPETYHPLSMKASHV